MEQEINNQKCDATNIKLPKVFEEILESDKYQVMLYGGRLGGKSNGTAIVCIKTMLENPYTDIVVCRVSYGSMADSSYAEIESALNLFGEEITSQFILKKSPLRIERKNGAGTIYFIGYGGSNTSRTKSIRPKHKIGMVILEETQELKTQRNLDEALASFRRHFGKQVKVFVLFNPPPQEAHWINQYKNKCMYDEDWIVRRITWEDIKMFINDYDLKEILKTKLLDENYYNWFYMGETTGGFGSVYPMFRKEQHIITLREWEKVKQRTNLKIVGCVIGGDGAVTHDATAFVPLLLLNNGQAIVGNIFYHNPQEDGVVGYHYLVQELLTRWFDELCLRFNLGSIRELMEHPDRARKVPIYMRIDSASPDLIQECRFFLGQRCDISAIQKKSILEMVGITQSAIMNDNINIIEYGEYKDYYKNINVKRELNILAEQINMLIWNEKQDGYDPIVPNDVCDAFTYATLFWYSNQENIQFFNIVRANGGNIKKVKDLLKEIEQLQ